MPPADYADLVKAKNEIEQQYLGKAAIHTVYIGEIEKNGVPTGETGIVALVDEKIPTAQLATKDVLPQRIYEDGNVIRVDVQQAPQPKDLRLFLNDAQMQYMVYNIQNVNNLSDNNPIHWQKCFDCPLPGGVQIAPVGADWVGTLSCAVKFKNADGKPTIGALTNYHVAVSQEMRGLKIGQPTGNADWFAKLDRWSAMEFSPNASNRTDAALLNTWRDDGLFSPGCHTVKPEQYNLGKINPDPILSYKIGDIVHKSGRTTGCKTGRVVGIDASTHVAYSQGTARFIGQIIVRGENGLFSGPGDSGSLVLTKDGNCPYGLLFAGGGDTTIINPISSVIKEFSLEFLPS